LSGHNSTLISQSRDINISKDFEKHKEEIEKIIDGITCPKDLKCYKSGSENLGKTNIMVLINYCSGTYMLL